MGQQVQSIFFLYKGAFSDCSVLCVCALEYKKLSIRTWLNGSRGGELLRGEPEPPAWSGRCEVLLLLSGRFM